MTDLETSPLLPRHIFDELMMEVASKVEAVAQGPSAYRTLAELATIYQALGNYLAHLIYQESGTNGAQRLACASGCSVCCHVPSEVRVRDKRNFSMSYLDVISLVENYADIKTTNSHVNCRAIAAVEEAKRTEALQPCPHLTANGTCGIYAHRPLPCKMWFSADLGLCIRNHDLGYEADVNSLTDLSRSIGTAFAEPFADYVHRIDPGREFWGYDFLEVFEEVAKLDERGLLGTLRKKIDAGDLASWDPFDSQGTV